MKTEAEVTVFVESELRYFDTSVQQVAEALACPENTVKTLLFRARARLKEMLPAGFGD